MIYISKLHVGNSKLKLKTSDIIDKKIRKELQELIDDLYLNLNHNLEESEAYKFNMLNVNKESKFSDYFIKFLELNINLARSYRNYFNPILPENLDIAGELIEREENYIKKLVDFALDTSFLRKTFLLDYLNQYISETLEWTDYMLELDKYFCAKGNKEWVIAHESMPGTYGIKNECLLLDEYSIFNYTNIIISSDSSCVNKLEYSVFPVMQSAEDFQKYSEENNLEFIIIDADRNYYQFPR